MQLSSDNRQFPLCLLSDCDGVIVDSEKIADGIMLEVLQEAFGSEGVETHLKDLFGRRVIDIIQLLEARIGVFLTAEKRSLMHMDIDARVGREAPAMPGVREVYEALGLPVGVVSNSAPHRLQMCVRRSGLSNLVGINIFSGDEVPNPKPAPDVYLGAARAMGFAPEQCLVIEDSVTGVTAARAAGMQVLGFLGGSHIRPDHADMLSKAGVHSLFSSMSELPHVIKNLNS